MIDINKKYTTRDGREVRIYATDGALEYCVHGSANHISMGWMAQTWTINGKSNICANMDLIEVRPRHKRIFWINISPEGHYPGVHFSKESADRLRRPDCIACIKVELDFAEGDGL